MMFSEESIEKFIRDNKDKFGVYHPPSGHMEKFLFKARYRFHYIINIVPHLIRLAIVSILIFTASVILWNNFIRKDRNEITLGNKISLVVKKIVHH